MGYLYKENNAETLIVSFGGHAQKFGGVHPFEFQNFLSTNFPNIDHHFYTDEKMKWYARGIGGLTINIDQSVRHIKSKIKRYKKTYFVGVSSGGYAAILFGSLAKANHVLAFIPQTKSPCCRKYSDLQNFINKTTNYTLYANISIKDENDIHHASHCERIAHFPNVEVVRLPSVRLREMRNNGELLKIFKKYIGE